MKRNLTPRRIFLLLLLTVLFPLSISATDSVIIPEPTIINVRNEYFEYLHTQLLLAGLLLFLILVLATLIYVKVRMVRRRRWRQETHRHGVFRKKQQEERQRRIPKEQPKQSKNNPEIYDDFERIDNFQLIGDQDIEIQVSGVTMDYRQEKDEASSFKELFIKSIKGKRHVKTFRALDNISFNVRRGEILGIIGTNGSGKTTLLKIISGVLPPTKGQVKVDRSKVQLLTLGTGFDMELTGRENVYLNGALIGYSRKYIDEHYNEIVSFAELEDFMEEKVKTYSSGMISRLGFAIATAREAPGILILDEVLSVGDIHFSKKSKARINELIHSGSTVLIVSHSLGTIREKCTRAIWIEKSKLMKQGDVKHVCEAYEKKDL